MTCINVLGSDGFETYVKDGDIYVRPKWIKVSDRLPEIYDYVLVFADNKGTGEPKPYSIARYDGENWDFVNHSKPMPNYGAWSDIGYPMDSEDVTHWMPLPNLPEEA